ncbi:MAG: hypothetical protein AB8B99_15580 [Phormidesmis sp.]
MQLQISPSTGGYQIMVPSNNPMPLPQSKPFPASTSDLTYFVIAMMAFLAFLKRH